MKVSAGILFIKNKKILLARVTDQNNWDIPKGQVDLEDEDHEATAIRECYEETGFRVEKEDLMPLGVIEYSHIKQLSLFLYTGEEYPDAAKCKCISTFDDKGVDKPENDDFEYIPLKEVSDYCVNNLVKALRRALDPISQESMIDERESTIFNQWNPAKKKK